MVKMDRILFPELDLAILKSNMHMYKCKWFCMPNLVSFASEKPNKFSLIPVQHVHRACSNVLGMQCTFIYLQDTFNQEISSNSNQLQVDWLM